MGLLRALIPQHAIACVPIGRAVPEEVNDGYAVARNATATYTTNGLDTGQLDAKQLFESGSQE